MVALRRENETNKLITNKSRKHETLGHIQNRLYVYIYIYDLLEWRGKNWLILSFLPFSTVNLKEGGKRIITTSIVYYLLFFFFFFFSLIVFARSSPVWMRAELLSKIHPSPSYPLKKTLQISVSTNSNFFFFLFGEGIVLNFKGSYNFVAVVKFDVSESKGHKKGREKWTKQSLIKEYLWAGIGEWKFCTSQIWLAPRHRLRQTPSIGWLHTGSQQRDASIK